MRLAISSGRDVIARHDRQGRKGIAHLDSPSNYSNIVQTTALKRLKAAFRVLFGGQRRDFGLFEGVEDVVNEEAGLGGGIVAQTREATGGIGGAGTGGSRYVGLAGTMGHGFFREPIDQ